MRINAVFQGGGMKGISLAGAVRAAEQNGVKFDRVAGTSSGAIVASLVAAGYTAQEMREVIEQTPFVKLLHRSAFFNVKWIGPAARIWLKKGLYSGELLEQWIRELLKAKGIQRFGDLPSGKLRVVASDITNGRIMVLPDDMERFDIEPATFDVARAIRMSTSIPYFFDPVMLRLNVKHVDKQSFAGQFVYIVDGAILSNLPLWLFDQEWENPENAIPTVGFQMVGKNKARVSPIRGPLSMLQAIIDTALSAHDERYIEQMNRFRTVKIPTLGVRTTQFNMTATQSEMLFASGLQAGNDFFRNWSTTAYQTKFKKLRLLKERTLV